MTRTLTLLPACLLSWLILSDLNGQKSGLQSRWHDPDANPFTIADYQEEDNVFYMVSNNHEYLFLDLIVPFSLEQRKILLFGLTVHVDHAGKPKKDLSILYPFRRTGGKYRLDKVTLVDSSLFDQIRARRDASSMRSLRGGPLMNFEILKYDMAEGARIMLLEGYSDTSDIVAISSSDPAEVHGWMAFDSSGALNYFLAIPFDKVPIRENLKNSGFNLGLETGFFNPETSPARAGGPQGRPGGRGGRPGGGTRGGGGRSGGMGTGVPGGQGGRPMMDPAQRQERMEQMQALRVPTKFWIKKIKLAYQE